MFNTLSIWLLWSFEAFLCSRLSHLKYAVSNIDNFLGHLISEEKENSHNISTCRNGSQFFFTNLNFRLYISKILL